MSWVITALSIALCHQLAFPPSLELFDMVFTAGCGRSGCSLFAINKCNRSARSGIFRALWPGVMFQDTFLQVFGDAGIEAVVTALDDIDIPGIHICFLL
jgi:hypothetical protein